MFNWLKRKKGIKPQDNLSLKTDEDKILALLNYATSATSVPVNESNALQVASVYACVNVIAGTLSTLPIQLIHRRGDRREIVTNTATSYMLRHEAYPGIPAQVIICAILANTVLRGNGFAVKGRNGNGSISSLTPRETQLMSWEHRTNKWLYTPHQGEQERYTEEEVLHVRNFSLGGGLGVDPVGVAREIIGLAIALDNNAAKFFANGSRLGTVFEADRALPPESRKALEKKLREQHEGPDNAHRSLILENGLKVAVNRAKNNEAQLDETRKHQIVEIARFFGVPPHKIGVMQNIPRANAEEANLAFITDTLSRYATLLENTLNIQVLGRQAIANGFYCKVNMAALLKGTLKDRYAAYAVGRQWGWLSVNDIRDREDMDPVENGDIYLQPANMIEAGTEPVNVAPNTPPQEPNED